MAIREDVAVGAAAAVASASSAASPLTLPNVKVPAALCVRESFKAVARLGVGTSVLDCRYTAMLHLDCQQDRRAPVRSCTHLRLGSSSRLSERNSKRSASSCACLPAVSVYFKAAADSSSRIDVEDGA